MMSYKDSVKENICPMCGKESGVISDIITPDDIENTYMAFYSCPNCGWRWWVDYSDEFGYESEKK